jgi:TonB family protein
MAPIVKENESAVATPASPAASVAAKNPQDAATRPQPVALELPVSINGARTVEGSDKREPFSETTQTVLVFGHGCVIRLSSALAPGQLVFLTNEKTKKEVVCQVVKSKADSSGGGYLELAFTEPAAGFWGMRFPNERVTPVATAPSAPRPTAPAISAQPKTTAPVVALPAPATSSPAMQNIAPPPPVAVKPVAPAPPAKPATIAPPVAPVASVTPVTKIDPPAPPVQVQQPAKPVESPVATLPQVPAVVDPPAPIEPPVVASAPVAIQPPAPTIVVAPPAVEAKVIEIPKPVIAAPPENSSESLRLQAARLQEQLNALLFTEAQLKQAASTLTAYPTLTSPANSPEATGKEVASESSSDLAQKVLQLSDLAPQIAAPPEPKPAIIHTAPAAPRNIDVSFPTEEVKIPDWLAPLARETENKSSESSSASNEDSESATLLSAANSSADSSDGSSHEQTRRPETAVFGGQLLGEAANSSTASTSGSKKGFYIGVAAALLLVPVGAWYMNQPGNAISALLASKTAATQPASTTSSSPDSDVSLPASSAAAVTTNSSRSSTSQPSITPLPKTSDASGITSAVLTSRDAVVAPRSNPPVAVEKKPVLGDVRLASPVVSQATTQVTAGEGEPSIGAEAGAASSDPLAGIASGHTKGPDVPLPVGGDVKSAKLIKSVPPFYPEIAKTQHIAGNVQIDALIDTYGNVTTMKVLSGPTLLHQAALQAVKQWKYEPAQLDGKPTSMHLTVIVQFRAQ